MGEDGSTTPGTWRRFATPETDAAAQRTQTTISHMSDGELSRALVASKALKNPYIVFIVVKSTAVQKSYDQSLGTKTGMMVTIVAVPNMDGKTNGELSSKTLGYETPIRRRAE
ncbi:hypothetical protein BC938DRAFT_475194 [Jimgerdemannia flammicorona]|uniref:Uncharacterized protein n=1 Tax=Jimgerdemannia flammicorona TaxID=994334 RepID=A0A433QRU0_9FUNG|nr:hypothetical protein BC938DRAFT_475194 [Jimgerdemannia flammicorona]